MLRFLGLIAGLTAPTMLGGIILKEHVFKRIDSVWTSAIAGTIVAMATAAANVAHIGMWALVVFLVLTPWLMLWAWLATAVWMKRRARTC